MLGAVGFRLDMDGGNDVVQRGIAAVFGREIASLDAGVVTEPEVLAGFQPGVAEAGFESHRWWWASTIGRSESYEMIRRPSGSFSH